MGAARPGCSIDTPMPAAHSPHTPRHPTRLAAQQGIARTRLARCVVPAGRLRTPCIAKHHS
eukprot:350891-Chlamydomonas_euryale.AAC.15